jgi:tRNA-Thr(GGU) m(6)t(6)A37 methyltransferase TsaA
VEVDKRFEEGLTDLETFSHIVLICHLHLSKDFSLMSKPPVDDRYHGVFATRSPRRPNPIGISVVRLEKVEGNILQVRDVDIIDDTPVLDIKPYVPEVNPEDSIRYGWLEGKMENK